MKKTILLALIGILIGASQPINAQEMATEPVQEVELAKNYFSISLFNLFANQFQLSYEREFGDPADKHGLMIMSSAILNNDPQFEVSSGFTAELHYRKYLISKLNPKGKAKNPFKFDFYCSPYVGYQYLEYTEPGGFIDPIDPTVFTEQQFITSFNALNGGVVFGTKMTFFERLSLDFYMGGGAKYTTNKIDNLTSIFSVHRPNVTGIIGKANFQIGMAF